MDSEQIEKILRDFARSRVDVVRRVQRILNDRGTERVLEQAGRIMRETGSALVKDALRASRDFAEAFGEAMPDNWHGLTNPQIFAAVELMEGTGWSLLWTPPAETVIEILETRDPDRRREILLDSEARILFDLDSMLERIEQASLQNLREAGRESLEAYRCGLFSPSQALSASILSSALHQHLGESKHSKVRERFAGANEKDAPIREFRWVAVQVAVGKVLEQYNPATGLPERSDFNRHASAHRVKKPQYRQVNALSALMLVTALLMELDEIEPIEP
jgi:hypothetical protein